MIGRKVGVYIGYRDDPASKNIYIYYLLQTYGRENNMFFFTHFPSTKQSVIKTSRRSTMHSIEVAHSKDLVMNIRN